MWPWWLCWPVITRAPAVHHHAVHIAHQTARLVAAVAAGVGVSLKRVRHHIRHDLGHRISHRTARAIVTTLVCIPAAVPAALLIPPAWRMLAGPPSLATRGPTPAPEPSTLPVLAGAIVILLALRR